MAIISTSYARRLIKAGKATYEGTVEHPTIMGESLAIITRHDLCRVDHCDPWSSHGGARDGAGRPRSDDPIKRRTIALRASEWEEYDALAESNGLGIADQLRVWISQQ